MHSKVVDPAAPSPSGAAPGSKCAVIDQGGTAQIPPFAVPPSVYMSNEAKRRLAARPYVELVSVDWASLTPDEQREATNNWYRPFVERARVVYSVRVTEQLIAGVRADVVVPADGIAAGNRDRVLINLHGGGYSYSSAGGLAGLAEAVPLAGHGKLKVITLDYKTSPRHKFPAAIRDVVAVYRHLLRTHAPGNIGIYGCSTGATLTASVIAWLQQNDLPTPGAIGLFHGGATKDDQVEGDSYYLAPAMMGDEIPAPGQPFPPAPYMEGTDPADPLVAPATSLEVLAGFPPTLLIAGTRDILLSAAVYTHARLVKAGAVADLHVWEGMWHSFCIEVDLPEAREVYDVATRFFDRHLQANP